jgi:hypothetical protein
MFHQGSGFRAALIEEAGTGCSLSADANKALSALNANP